MAEDLSQSNAPLDLDQPANHTAPPAFSTGEDDAPFTARQRPEHRLVQKREVVAVGLMVVLADATIFYGQGYAGLGLLFVVAPLLLMLAKANHAFGRPAWIVGGMLLVLGVKLVWCGSALLVAAGFTLLVGFAMALAGHTPYIIELVVYGSQTVLAGYGGLLDYRQFSTQNAPRFPRSSWLGVILPVATVVTFGTLFVLANPDLLKTFGDGFEWFVVNVRGWIVSWLPRPLEPFFWLVVIWLTLGLLRPVVRFAVAEHGDDALPREKLPVAEAPLYGPFRNTLVTVIGLFAVYLVFEFATLWFREFPDGFYYSGYAHEGAAWLTVALALATVTLSLVFRGSILHDPRLSSLRRLAWIWSFENVLLAIAVYNRLFIYIGFNGMTRMRMVAIFGMTAVVAGFVLVLVKIACNKNFTWLVRRHLWALAITIYLFALLPVDAIVVNYNVSRILRGDSAPSVQISVHPISAEGVPALRRLLDCSDEKVREGVRAMLAERLEAAQADSDVRRARGWTAYQAAESRMLSKLQSVETALDVFDDPRQRAERLQHFHEYAYRWY